MLFGCSVVLLILITIIAYIILVIAILRQIQYKENLISSKTFGMHRQLTYSLMVQVTLNVSLKLQFSFFSLFCRLQPYQFHL
jgi:hypothetical protein